MQSDKHSALAYAVEYLLRADASSIPVFQDVPASDALETQAIMVGRCLERDDRRSTLPVRHRQAVIEDAPAVQGVGVESPRG